jgi:hypothetical protein
VGVEVKGCACVASGLLLYIEIQESSAAMALKPYRSVYKATTACTLRLTQNWHSTQWVVVSDSGGCLMELAGQLMMPFLVVRWSTAFLVWFATGNTAWPRIIHRKTAQYAVRGKGFPSWNREFRSSLVGLRSSRPCPRHRAHLRLQNRRGKQSSPIRVHRGSCAWSQVGPPLVFLDFFPFHIEIADEQSVVAMPLQTRLIPKKREREVCLLLP